MEKNIDVLWDNEWEKYTIEDVKNSFNFSVEPNYEKIEEIIVHEGGNGWLEVKFETGEYPFVDIVNYDRVHSSYVKSIG